MIALLFLIIGAALGWARAARRGGTTGDKLLYAVGHGLALGLAAMAIGVILHGLGLFDGM